MFGLTPCRQLRPSSWREHFKQSQALHKSLHGAVAFKKYKVTSGLTEGKGPLKREPDNTSVAHR